MKDYRKSFNTQASAERVYDAISLEMSNWWVEMSATFKVKGDKAKTNFGGKSYWVLQAVALNKPHLIKLQCCEAEHIHDGLSDGIRQEWLNTKLCFMIETREGLTRVTLEHRGLTPQLECYEVCKAGWDFYFLKGLKEYLEKGCSKKKVK